MWISHPAVAWNVGAAALPWLKARFARRSPAGSRLPAPVLEAAG